MRAYRLDHLSLDRVIVLVFSASAPGVLGIGDEEVRTATERAKGDGDEQA